MAAIPLLSRGQAQKKGLTPSNIAKKRCFSWPRDEICGIAANAYEGFKEWQVGRLYKRVGCQKKRWRCLLAVLGKRNIVIREESKDRALPSQRVSDLLFRRVLGSGWTRICLVRQATVAERRDSNKMWLSIRSLSLRLHSSRAVALE